MQLEWVLRVFPWGGIGCSIALLFLALVRNRRGNEQVAQEVHVLTIIFRDYADGVEGLMRWLLWQKWWLESPGRLLIGVESGEKASYDEMLAILSRLQRKSQLFDLMPDEEYFFHLKRSDSVVLIKKGSKIPWQKLKEMLKEPASQTA